MQWMDAHTKEPLRTPRGPGSGRGLLGGLFHMEWMVLTDQAIGKSPCWLQTWCGTLMQGRAIPGLPSATTDLRCCFVMVTICYGYSIV